MSHTVPVDPNDLTFPDGTENSTPIREVINRFSPDHRSAIADAEDSLTAAYTAASDELDLMAGPIQGQIAASSDAALALLETGYNETKAKLPAVQDTLDGIYDWLDQDLPEVPAQVFNTSPFTRTSREFLGPDALGLRKVHGIPGWCE